MRRIIDKLVNAEFSQFHRNKLMDTLCEQVKDFPTDDAITYVVPKDFVQTIRNWSDAGLFDSNETLGAAYRYYFAHRFDKALCCWLKLSSMYEDVGFLNLTRNIDPESVMQRYFNLMSVMDMGYLAYRCLFYEDNEFTGYNIGAYVSVSDWIKRVRKDGLLVNEHGAREINGKLIFVLSGSLHLVYEDCKFKLMSTHVLAESDYVHIKQRAKVSEEWAAFSAYTAALQVCLYDSNFSLFAELNNYVRKLFKSLDIILTIDPITLVQNCITECEEILEGFRIPSNVPGWDVVRFKVDGLHVYATIPVNGIPTTYDVSLESMLEGRDWSVSLFPKDTVRLEMLSANCAAKDFTRILALFGIILNNRQQRSVKPNETIPSLHPERFKVYDYYNV